MCVEIRERRDLVPWKSCSRRLRLTPVDWKVLRGPVSQYIISLKHFTLISFAKRGQQGLEETKHKKDLSKDVFLAGNQLYEL